MYDVDQVYSDKPYATVLGIQLKPENTDVKGGLVILGASASALAGKVSHNYLESLADSITGIAQDAGLDSVQLENINSKKDLDKLINSITDSVRTHPLHKTLIKEVKRFWAAK